MKQIDSQEEMKKERNKNVYKLTYHVHFNSFGSKSSNNWNEICGYGATETDKTQSTTKNVLSNENNKFLLLILWLENLQHKLIEVG